MKIIDLLNKIANGEKVPKKIEVLSNNEIFNFDNEAGDYSGENGDYLFGEVITNVINLQLFLNDEVEIIEEDKEIEKINYYATNRVKNEFAVDYIENGETKKFCLNKKQRYFANKINKLIDKVNNMEDNK